MAKKIPTPTAQELQELYELQELWDIPDEVKQRDLEEILEAQFRVRAAGEELDSLRAQLETALALGRRVEPGKLSIVADDKGRKRIVEAPVSTQAAWNETPY